MTILSSKQEAATGRLDWLRKAARGRFDWLQQAARGRFDWLQQAARGRFYWRVAWLENSRIVNRYSSVTAAERAIKE